MHTIFWILLILFGWHCLFIHSIAILSANQPTNESDKKIELLNICSVNIFSNVITLCVYGTPFCLTRLPNTLIAYLDPYHFIFPLQIKICV